MYPPQNKIQEEIHTDLSKDQGIESCSSYPWLYRWVGGNSVSSSSQLNVILARPQHRHSIAEEKYLHYSYSSRAETICPFGFPGYHKTRESWWQWTIALSWCLKVCYTLRALENTWMQHHLINMRWDVRLAFFQIYLLKQKNCSGSEISFIYDYFFTWHKLMQTLIYSWSKPIEQELLKRTFASMPKLKGLKITTLCHSKFMTLVLNNEHHMIHAKLRMWVWRGGENIPLVLVGKRKNWAKCNFPIAKATVRDNAYPECANLLQIYSWPAIIIACKDHLLTLKLSKQLQLMLETVTLTFNSAH